MKISKDTIGKSGTAGACAIILVYIIEQFDVKLSTEVAQAISTLISSLFGLLFMQANKPDEEIKEDKNEKS